MTLSFQPVILHQHFSQYGFANLSAHLYPARQHFGRSRFDPLRDRAAFFELLIPVRLYRRRQFFQFLDQGIEQGYRAAGDAGANTYFGNVNPQTGLGKATTSQYELDKSNIQRTAQDSIAVGQKMLAQRGMQGSPGAMSSLLNTTNRNADMSTNSAYNTALQNQQQLGLAGIGYNQQQQQLYNPLMAIGTATGAYGQGGNSAAQRAGMGSMGGDILGGVGTLAGAAGSVMTGLGAMNRRT